MHEHKGPNVMRLSYAFALNGANLLGLELTRWRCRRLPRRRTMISILYADGESHLFSRCHFGLRLA